MTPFLLFFPSIFTVFPFNFYCFSLQFWLFSLQFWLFSLQFWLFSLVFCVFSSVLVFLWSYFSVSVSCFLFFSVSVCFGFWSVSLMLVNFLLRIVCFRHVAFTNNLKNSGAGSFRPQKSRKKRLKKGVFPEDVKKMVENGGLKWPDYWELEWFLGFLGGLERNFRQQMVEKASGNQFLLFFFTPITGN